MSDLFNIVMYLIGVVIVLAVMILPFFIMWEFFKKTGRPGWAGIIPVYNIYVLMEIAGRPGWWIILYFIPLVNIIIAAIVALDIAKAFNRSTAFGVIGLFLFSIIGYAMLAFGNDTYRQPVNNS